MEPKKIENKIKELQQEYQKGLAVVQDTQVKMLRIEGAIIKLQELLKELREEKQQVQPENISRQLEENIPTNNFDTALK